MENLFANYPLAILVMLGVLVWHPQRHHEENIISNIRQTFTQKRPLRFSYSLSSTSERLFRAFTSKNL